MKKRLMSAFLSLCMVLTMVPAALATEESVEEDSGLITPAESNNSSQQQEQGAQDENTTLNDVYTITPDMTQEEVDTAIQNAT